MICLSLTASGLDENLRLIESCRGHIDMCELRADFLDEWDVPRLRSFPGEAGVPVILTLRRREDGGNWRGSEADRAERLREVLSAAYGWIDLESGSDTADIAAQARSLGVAIIRSLHDFKGVPDDLAERVKRLAEAPGEIPKYAVMPSSTADLRRVVQALKLTRGPRIILGMGDWGFATRILARRLGSMLSFVSAPGACAAAPGHLDPETLSVLYRYPSLGENTRIFGVIGNPVMHSRSPQIHNPAYSRQGLDAVYLPFRVDDLTEWFALCDDFPVEGFSVTVPHKEEVLRFLDIRDTAVDAIGACNTVFRSAAGWSGANTDVAGFLKPLEELYGPSGLSGLKATVIGAGGAARAVVYALRLAGADVLVLNRTPSKAEILAERFDCASGGLVPGDYAVMKGYDDLIVQTTPAGMHPKIDLNPLSAYPWKGSEVAYDLIYLPEQTRFLAAAAAAGCRTLNGAAMLEEQGKLQYRLFTGKEYPGPPQ
jgi:3-dehydroquinate dehydratase / shikimate dehydrogenase